MVPPRVRLGGRSKRGGLDSTSVTDLTGGCKSKSATIFPPKKARRRGQESPCAVPCFSATVGATTDPAGRARRGGGVSSRRRKRPARRIRSRRLLTPCRSPRARLLRRRAPARSGRDWARANRSSSDVEIRQCGGTRRECDAERSRTKMRRLGRDFAPPGEKRNPCRCEIHVSHDSRNVPRCQSARRTSTRSGPLLRVGGRPERGDGLASGGDDRPATVGGSTSRGGSRPARGGRRLPAGGGRPLRRAKVVGRGGAKVDARGAGGR